MGLGMATVHPHARGDEKDIRNELYRAVGPPPRAWGRGSHRPHHQAGRRSTPTRVGTSTDIPESWPLASVHPHARGDEEKMTWPVLLPSGPPPRAWGRGCLTGRV